jgi:hypothetical protein
MQPSWECYASADGSFLVRPLPDLAVEAGDDEMLEVAGHSLGLLSAFLPFSFVIWW